MRQAIVLIHGIGEPRPMSTLRAFVDGVIENEVGLGRVVRSKPDRLSESFELRRLVVDGTRSRPATDCYELYWAHHMAGNTLAHLWPLARLLLLRWPTRVPRVLLPLWALTWTLLVGLAWSWTHTDPGALDTLRLSNPIWWLAGTVVVLALQYVAAKFLGDAARYLSPTPDNVAIRHAIRSEGVRVLRRIQRKTDYDRIIVVGHSLGSVIGYDILTHLWDECNTVHSKPDRPNQKALRDLQTAGDKLDPEKPETRTAYREAQRALWCEQRSHGNPWLITDFITLGSPMTYAALLFAEDAAELVTRQGDRELPTCPPQKDDGKYYYRPKKTYDVGGKPRTLFLLHHAAPFAVTRWTNLFVPLRFGLLGDWVGGPLRAAFGVGIEDVPVADSWVRHLPLYGHIRYWHVKSRGSLASLKRALDLNSREWLPKRQADETPETSQT